MSQPPLLSLGCAALLAACTVAHPVRTVGQGRFSYEAGLGGPLATNLGPPIPMPSLYMGARYGLRDDLDLSLNTNLVAPVIPGIGLDLQTAAHWVPIQPGLRSQADTPTRGWSLAGTLGVEWLTDFKNGFMVFPLLKLAAGWRYEWFNPYLGSALVLHAYRPFEQGIPLQLDPYLGIDWSIGQRASIVTQVMFMDVGYNLYGSGLDWVYLADKPEERRHYGVVTPMLGFSWDFAPRNEG